MSGTHDAARPRSTAYAKFLDIDHTVYMTVEEAIALSRDLADVISTSGRPDLLVGVANGALLPMKVVAEELGIPFQVIHLRRKGSRYKQKLFALKEALGIPTSLLTTRPMRAVQTWFEQRTSTLEEANDAFTFDVLGKDVMIIDDAIQTGRTARHLKERLFAKGAAKARVAVICWYQGVDDSGEWSPDLYLNRQHQWYPWSNNSPYFEKTLTWLANNGLSFWR
ncbi:phosphoribosyltransferase [Rhodopila sp.]|uniref:phosphoribosyltransferase n=1 Tax=Rhodopila sp. TaxID=2480087 RepID=UPI003D12A7B7